MVVINSHDASQRCEQVRKLWDSMKIPLAKERSQLDHALAEIMEENRGDGLNEEEWRYETFCFLSGTCESGELNGG